MHPRRGGQRPWASDATRLRAFGYPGPPGKPPEQPRSVLRILAGPSPDMNSPYGLFMPGEGPGLWTGAACKAPTLLRFAP